MKWQWQQNILSNHSQWWDHLRARYLFPLLLFPPLCLLSTQLYTIQMSQQNTIHYRWSTQLYMIQMLRHAPLSEICPLFLLTFLLLLSFILPSCPPHPHFYHLISLHLMMRIKLTMVRGHDMIYTNLLHMRKMVIQEARMTMVRSHSNHEEHGERSWYMTNMTISTNLLHMRKMVIQEARMTRQSTATITDMRWRWGSPTEVDSWNRDWSDLIRFDQMGDDYQNFNWSRQLIIG